MGIGVDDLAQERRLVGETVMMLFEASNRCGKRIGRLGPAILAP
jgi:hypothetical protein